MKNSVWLDTGYHPNSDLLSARVILVTGAGAGIGKACALTFAQHGATVILHGRRLDRLEETYDQISRLDAPEPMLLPLDLAKADEADYEQVADAILTRFGKLDGLLHNAGILGDLVPLAYYQPAQFNELLQVNLVSAFLLTQKLMPALEKADDASIVFTSSGVGRHARAYWGAYSVSKFGVEALMGIWADELENLGNIRCNSLNPGATRTQMRAKARPAEDPMQLPAAEALMPLYLYLMGADSKGVTGRQFNAQDWRYKAVADA